jgi:hypothetical protein
MRELEKKIKAMDGGGGEGKIEEAGGRYTSFRTGRLEQELQMVQLSATR